jgi:type II secretion system protein C
MTGARSSRRSLLVLSAGLALAIAWAIGRGSAPQDGAPTAATRPPAADVAAPPPGASDVAASPAPDYSGIPRTRLPLRLLVTVVRENRTLSLATIEDVERDAREVMNEGQSFEGHPRARIARIERARVLIDNDGVREQLVIDHSDAGEPDAVGYEPTPEEREQRRDLAQRLRALTDAGPNYRELRGRGTRGGLLAEGDVRAVYEDGELIGVQLDAIREGGVYDRFGLRNGDVVTDINGISLGHPSAAAEVLAQFAVSDELQVSVERGDGSLETLSISTADFKTAVEELD